MFKPRDISETIDKVWIPRDTINRALKRYKQSPLPILIVGPSQSGKSAFGFQEYTDDNARWESIGGNSHSDETQRFDLRKDPSSTTGVFIHFPYYKMIQDRATFFSRLQKDILRQFSTRILGKEITLLQAFEQKTGFSSESALDFFNVLDEFTRQKKFLYSGKINIYFCGLQYIFPDIVKSFLEYLRAFMDHVYGNPSLERMTLVLTSLRDGYHLTETYDNVCSPLNALKRIYMNDLGENEFYRFIDKTEKECALTIENPYYLYTLTKGDIYLTKTILTYCEANSHIFPAVGAGQSTVVNRNLIDKAVDYILSPPNTECMMPFRALKQFIDQHDEVRDVLYQLNSGTSLVPMTDTSGVYTIPESSGAVVKKEYRGKYGYAFRNEIYRRFVEQYIRQEEQKVESIISETFGKGDMSFPATLAAAIRHEMSGPIGIISAELSRLLSAPHMTAEDIECLEAIRSANFRLASINTFLQGSWGISRNLETIRLNEYIEKNITVFQPHLFRNKIRVTFNFDPKINSIRLDTGALKILLVNLILNARDAILPQESGAISIETKSHSQGIKLYIKDNGIGMDKYTLQQILEHGFSTKLKGKGIGLTLCKTAVRRMNATLNVQSKVGKGTEVLITFRKERTKQNEK